MNRAVRLLETLACGLASGTFLVINMVGTDVLTHTLGAVWGAIWWTATFGVVVHDVVHWSDRVRALRERVQQPRQS